MRPNSSRTSLLYKLEFSIDKTHLLLFDFVKNSLILLFLLNRRLKLTPLLLHSLVQKFKLLDLLLKIRHASRLFFADSNLNFI